MTNFIIWKRSETVDKVCGAEEALSCEIKIVFIAKSISFKYHVLIELAVLINIQLVSVVYLHSIFYLHLKKTALRFTFSVAIALLKSTMQT